MLTEELKEKYHPLRNEIIEMNISMYFLTDKAKQFKKAFEVDRELMLFVMTSFSYFENGLIMHLTNLDDESSSKKSFHDVRKDLERINCDPGKLKKLKKEMKSYRDKVNFLKIKYRNKRIAHLNHDSVLDIPEMDEFIPVKLFRPLVDKANEIGDLIWGEEIRALFKMGGISFEGHLDFRSGKIIYGLIT
jgi:hypothetical protein